MKELIKPNGVYDEKTEMAMSKDVEGWLKQLCEEAQINPSDIKSIADLGCGHGKEVMALLDVFPNANIWAVDYHGLLKQVKLNPRVIFKQGLIINVLRQYRALSVDLTVIRHVGYYHGFVPQTAFMLKNLVGNGRLFTGIGNGEMENTTWFNSLFERIPSKKGGIWKPKIV